MALLKKVKTDNGCGCLEIYREDNNGYITLNYGYLGIYSSEETYVEAIEDLAQLAKEYAELYFDEYDSFKKDMSRRHHEEMLKKILHAKTDDEVLEILGMKRTIEGIV